MTATKKTTKTIVKTDRDKASSSIHEITGFDIQTGDICKPHLNGALFWVASIWVEARMAVLIENSVTAYTTIIIIISSQNHRIKATSTPLHKRSGFSLLKNAHDVPQR